MSKEKWKIHPTITNLEVSDLGNFKMVDHYTIRSVHPNTFGYRVLSWKMIQTAWYSTKTLRCANLVAETWIGPRPEGCVISHKNENRADDRACNLEYVTPAENEANKSHKGITSNYIKNRVGYDVAREIRKKFKTESLQTLAKEYNKSVSTISKIISNKSYPDPDYVYIRDIKKENKKQDKMFQKNVTRWSKLSPDDVRAIRVASKAGKTYNELAAQFGVKADNIWLIVHRKRWKWVK